MKLFHLSSALKTLKAVSAEIQYSECFKAERFSGGLIAFRPNKTRDPKQINHSDQDVVCHVIKGRGRLRIGGEHRPLRPGVVCHIPKGTPHDFAAGRSGELVLFYLLIRTG